ncbi:MAG: phosphate butyryltransferase Ptb [Oscillospiraceae bacterium]|jgi:phosphotransacetylase|nr:phosphate butyryltransferase Ptb [Oscillospiraceae bacterium]
MNITKFEDFAAEAKKMPKKAVVAVIQAQDEHTLDAIANAKKEGIVEARLYGLTDKITALLKEVGADPADFEIIQSDSEEEAIAAAVADINAGKASAIMKGKLDSANFLRAVVSKENGLRGSGKLSLVGFYDPKVYHKLFAVSDMGMNTTPDAEGKKAIINNAVALLRKLGIDKPKVAVLSESEKVNAKIPASVDAGAIKEAWAAGEFAQDAIIEGPISFDLATDAGSAVIKGYSSPVAGDADLLIVPDVVTGNVLVKCLTGIAKTNTAGTILGAKIPVIMTSRSAEASDKFYSIALAALASQE